MSDYPVDMNIVPDVKAFFDEATNTISYVVKDPNSNACAVVDSVMDIDYAAGRITFDHADQIIADILVQFERYLHLTHSTESQILHAAPEHPSGT